ncbi:hypothetical protein Tco_0457946 [Tanacetum coccineum]
MAANAPLAVFVTTKRTPLAANLLNQTHLLMRRCGGSSGGWSGGDGDDMVSVDGDSSGTRGGVWHEKWWPEDMTVGCGNNIIMGVERMIMSLKRTAATTTPMTDAQNRYCRNISLQVP